MPSSTTNTDYRLIHFISWNMIVVSLLTSGLHFWPGDPSSCQHCESCMKITLKVWATWGGTADCPRVVSQSCYLDDPGPWHSKSCHRTILIDWHLHYGTAAVYNCMLSDWTTSHDECMAAPTHRRAKTLACRAKNAKQRSIINTWRNNRGLPPYKLPWCTHLHVHIDEYCSESANRMSEVQPAEFIYYKYTQTHTHALSFVCSLAHVWSWHICSKEEESEYNKSKGWRKTEWVCEVWVLTVNWPHHKATVTPIFLILLTDRLLSSPCSFPPPCLFPSTFSPPYNALLPYMLRAVLLTS